MRVQTFRILLAGTLIGSMLYGQAFATDVMPEVVGAVEAAVVSPEITARINLGVAAMSSDELDIQRGGADTQVLNKSTLNGVVSDNQVNSLNTGSNLVTEGSFAGTSGFATVIQNSGNNVLIQNSTIINLHLQ